MLAPRGQKKPQNALPKTIVTTVTTSVVIAKPGIIERDAMNVRYPVSGLTRKSHLQSIAYARG